MIAWRAGAVVLLAACSAPTIDIGSNGPITIDGRVASHCSAPRTATEPRPGESEENALVVGRALLANDWALCPGSSPPSGLTPAFAITEQPGGFSAQVLVRASSNAYLKDTPLGDVRLGFFATTSTFLLTAPDGTVYLLTFAEPLRMFLANPSHPDVVLAAYAAF